jgi:hypothetical protein
LPTTPIVHNRTHTFQARVVDVVDNGVDVVVVVVVVDRTETIYMYIPTLTNNKYCKYLVKASSLAFRCGTMSPTIQVDNVVSAIFSCSWRDNKRL